MRTTVTLEDDLAARLADVARQSKRPFKTVLNDALRKGLGQSGPPEPKFVLKPHRGSLRPGIDDRRFNELIWDLEDPARPRKGGRRR